VLNAAENISDIAGGEARSPEIQGNGDASQISSEPDETTEWSPSLDGRL
jgi:hypothetical protein